MIKAEEVKRLRARTGSPLMDCKKALEKGGGDEARAIRYLKESGVMKAEAKRGRGTHEGVIFIQQGKRGGLNLNMKDHVKDHLDGILDSIIVEIACETDFVARNKDFLNGVESIVKKLWSSGVQEGQQLPDVVQKELEGLIVKLGENIKVERFASLKGDKNSYIESYIHQGKIGVLLKLKVGKEKTIRMDGFQDFAKDIAMQIASMSPRVVCVEDIKEEEIEEQRKIYLIHAKKSGESEKVVAKIMDGKLKQYYKQMVLLEQDFVKRSKMSVREYILEKSKDFQDILEVTKYIRYKVGE